MKVAVIGPVTTDTNVTNQRIYDGAGGTAYYAGNALASLGVETIVLGSCKDDMSKHFNCKFVHLMRDDTLRFVNAYDNGKRIQYAQGRQTIGYSDVKDHVKNMDCIILGPLLHDNIRPDLVRQLAKDSKIFLFGQGMIRHLEGTAVYLHDAGSILGVLDSIDYLILNNEEYGFVSMTGDPKKVRKGGALVVTQDREGSQIIKSNKIVDIPAFFPQGTVDQTGAGDTFGAGLLNGLVRYPHSLEKAGNFAAMVATMKIESRGPFRGTAADVIKRVVNETR